MKLIENITLFVTVLLGLQADSCAMSLDSLKNQSAQFDHNHNVAYFDMSLSQQDEQILDALQITNIPALRLYGNPQDRKYDIALYLESLGNDTQLSQRAVNIIHGLIMQVYQAYGSQAVSVVMRPMQITDKFNTPRWHMDNSQDPILQGDQLTKFVCALQGPGTLFAQISEQGRQDYLNLAKQLNQHKKASMSVQEKYQQSFDLERRAKIASIINQFPATQAPTRQGVVFAIENDAIGAFHSEPPIHADRLFLAIIPGTHEQIAHLQKLEIGK